PGPMTITDTVANSYYDDDAKLGADLAAAINKEFLALAAAGCTHIQIDEPVFARKPEQALAYGFENLDRCFHGAPEGVIRTVHMCCGYPDKLDNPNYAKADRNAYLRIADAIEDSSIQVVSLEDAHRHNDLSLLEHFKNTSVIFGAVAVAKSRVESVEEIRDRLRAALEHIDADRLIAAPDCGLGLLGRDLAMAKLKNLCAAAHDL
ncbi:MAG: 5-methyltetrahydropteroyltriglutamate--homocysteine methyltransferase, partial [Alphaproteobacteria bacterium]|nr:5-methyltetrahydropteroyltriglutamate--homocysteine methyltransferase [Alphaproteobacteria bacterium]